MRFVTWNINSVRLRIGLIERLIDALSPDVLCLQETKCPDEAFPHAPFAARGYAYRHIWGMKSYNGVAIISRLPLMQMGQRDWQGRADCRHIFATLPDQTEIHCLYVPAGGDVPDPDVNPKFAHKLGFLDEGAAWSREQKVSRPRILLGDLNVAPLEQDVWSHRQMLGVVSHTPIEVEKFTAWQQAGGWIDAPRCFIPLEEKLYSWWSYRAQDWEESNRGRRLDHVWVTPPLAPALRGAHVLRAARGWDPKPSDHVPVIVDVG